MVYIYKFWNSIFDPIDWLKPRQCTVFTACRASLFYKVRYSGCAPMYYKCRLHSNKHSKSS